MRPCEGHHPRGLYMRLYLCTVMGATLMPGSTARRTTTDWEGALFYIWNSPAPEMITWPGVLYISRATRSAHLRHPLRCIYGLLLTFFLSEQLWPTTTRWVKKAAAATSVLQEFSLQPRDFRPFFFFTSPLCLVSPSLYLQSWR